MSVLDEPNAAALVGEIADALDAGETRQAIAERLARHARPALVLAIVNHSLRRCASSLDGVVPFRGGLVNLANGPRFSLDLRYAFEATGEDMLPTGNTGSLLVRAADVVIANAGARPLRYSSFNLESVSRFEVFDPQARLTPGTDGEIPPGAALLVKGGRDAVSLKDVTGARFLSLAFLPETPLDWVFSRTDRRATAQSVAHVDDSELVTCLETAAWLGDRRTLEITRQLVQHSAHFVRWKAVQALGRIDRSSSLAAVREATEDVHPALRRAAAATLRAIGETGGGAN
jgi:hypothetical protein